MLFAPIHEPFVIDEHGGLVVLFKPRGWHSVAHTKGQGKAGNSMVQWLVAHARELPHRELTEEIDAFLSSAMVESNELDGLNGRAMLSGDRFATELGMLYRLDFETSGIMLFALTRKVFERMLRAQESGALEKHYVLACSESMVGVPGSMPVSRAGERDALLADIQAGKEGRVESYFRGYGERGARVACISPDFLQKTRKVTTKNLYETCFLRGVRDHSTKTIFLEASIRKGFRHQIRAHSAWMGLPIAGDMIYGGTPAERLMLEAHAVMLRDEDRIVDEWVLHTGIDAESD